jgi:hypothetical protein
MRRTLITASLVAWLVTAATAVAIPAPAGAAASGWQPLVTLPGVDPLLGFGPTGTAAIVTTQFDVYQADTGGEVYLSVRRAHASFQPAIDVPPVSFGENGQSEPAGVAPATNGATAILFDGSVQQSDMPLDVDVVTAAGTVEKPQQLQTASFSSEVGGPAGQITATADGDVVLTDSDEGPDSIYGATLAPGATAFEQGRVLSNWGAMAGDETLVADPRGDAWIASAGTPTSIDCTAVAFRPAGGAGFKITYEPPCPENTALHPARTPGLEVQGLAASGHAYAAMVTQQPTASGKQERFAVQVGRYGHFGRPIELDTVPITNASAFLDPTGVVADRHGRITVAWRRCNVYGWDCAIKAVTGTRAGRFGKPQTVVAPAPTPGVKVTATLADGTIAIQRCVKKRPCTLSESTVGNRGRFSKPRAIATGVQEQDFIGDDHGDLLLLYSRGSALYATVRNARATSFGPAIRLSTTAENPNVISTVTAAYGPDNDAIVTWSGQGATSAAVYDG